MEKYTDKMLYLAAVLMYFTATMYFVTGNMLLGIIYIAGGTCFTSSAAIYSKNKKDDHI